MSDDKRELVIIRRRSAFDDPPYKGGVWKIAYADFMTAMMAFFLVMWLLNALNQDQRKVVASVFNPIKLSEDAPAPKGLKDPTKKEPTASEGQEGKSTPAGHSQERRGDATTVEKPPFYEEKLLFRNPYATLTEIAAGSNQASGQRRVGALASPEEDGMKGGEAYRDPFDPGYWKLAPEAKNGPVSESESTAREDNADAAQDESQAAGRGKADDAGGGVAADGKAPSATMSPLLPPGQAAAARDGKPQASPQTSPQENATRPRPADTAEDARPRAPQADPQSAKPLQAAIQEALSDVKAGAGPTVEVRQVEEGVLISLTDDANFGMFALGSAEPRPELIRVIDKIGPLLTKREGTLIVRGHTDNRPYRSDTYDNWRLSTARAQMAYYMLVRSGVDPQRIEHVEGYADRRPKLPNDPAAAQNRRIEILIREKHP
jgi:chemotaxis protein MotB